MRFSDFCLGLAQEAEAWLGRAGGLVFRNNNVSNVMKIRRKYIEKNELTIIE